MSVRLQTKWLRVRILLLSFKLQIWRLSQARSFLTFRQVIEGGFNLKLVRDMIITYSQNLFSIGDVNQKSFSFRESIIEFISCHPYKMNTRNTPEKVINYLKCCSRDMRYSARCTFSRNLVHRKNFGLVWQVAFKLRYLFRQGR